MMMKETNQMYNIDLNFVRDIFMNIINDEEHHREILETIKQLTVKKEQASNDPFVKFQNPDVWSQPLLISNLISGGWLQHSFRSIMEVF